MPIRIAWGTAAGKSELGAFDAALAEAGLHNYNLVGFSSVVPPETSIQEVGTADPGWPVGERVGVVLARNVGRGRVVAGLGWTLAEEGGVLIEGYAGDPAECRREVETGLREARDLRDWAWTDAEETRIAADEFEGIGAAVVVAVYGPIASGSSP
ncbi:pyruvoyl-dependent arginine decarboxylase [Halobacteriales archaeon QS_8_69_26]|nr:MAG: pyruvoyl-dependent arginine decarboxylase [Halobacteriales archaeon QS_8_69_26]